MASVIRLLPRQQVERHTVPYRLLLGRVLRQRWTQAVKVCSFLSLTLIPVAKLVGITGTWRVFWTLLLIEALLLLHLKVEMTAATFTKSTWIAQKACDVISWRFLRGVIAYAVVTYIYALVLILPSLPDMQWKIAAAINTPQQLPPGLPIHFQPQPPKQHTNLRRLFLNSYALGLVILWEVMERRSLRFRKSELGVPASRRIARRASKTLKVSAMALAAHTVAVFVEFYVTMGSPGIFFGLIRFPATFIPLAAVVSLTIEIFDSYMTLGPVHHLRKQPGATICDASPDPNGSLADGLNSVPGTLTQLSAWHELAVIAGHKPQRRIALFADTDADRVIWNKVSDSALKLISDTSSKLERAAKSTDAAKAKVEVKDETQKSTAQCDTKLSLSQAPGTPKLPKQIDIHPADETIWIRGRKEPSWWPAILVERFEDQAERTVTTWLNAHVNRWRAAAIKTMSSSWSDFLASWWGTPFRHTEERRVAILLPAAERASVIWSVQGIGELIVASLEEDEIGHVQVTIGSYLDAVDKLLGVLTSYKNSSYAADLRDVATLQFARVSQRFWPYIDSLNVGEQAKRRAKKYITF